MSFLQRPNTPLTAAQNNPRGRVNHILSRLVSAVIQAADDITRDVDKLDDDYQQSQQRLKDVQRFLFETLKTPLEPKPEDHGDFEDGFVLGQKAVLYELAGRLGYLMDQLDPIMIDLELKKYEPTA